VDATYTADIDTGGTFTDGCFSDGERRWLVKVETTPHDLTVGLLGCLAEGARRIGLEGAGGLLARCEVIRFCTTLTTNALLEGRGTRLGLLATTGLADELERAGGVFGSGLLERELALEIDEEVDASGRVVRPPSPAGVVEAARRLLHRGARALVVALRRSAICPENEVEVERLLDARYPPHLLGHAPVVLSHRISEEPEDLERCTAALLDARVHGLLARALRGASDALRERSARRPLLVVHADGGCARVDKTRALETWGSGPAASVRGAARLAKERDLARAIVMDVGGTSTDLAFLEGGEPLLSTAGRIAGHAVGRPFPEILSLGLGGGSIARAAGAGEGAGPGGRVRLGPESAGALPGPACFDLGGEDPTLVDACLLLGYFDPERFLGGRRRLIAARAREAVSRLARELGAGVEEAAAGVKAALEEGVAAALRERAAGDLSGVRLIAGGGGGGLHAAAIATRLGIGEVHVPPFGPVLGAFGASTLGIVHVYPACLEGRSEVRGGELVLGAWFDERLAAARRDVEDEGFDPDRIELELQVALGPRGGAERLLRARVSAGQERVPLGPLAEGGARPRVAWLRAHVPLAPPTRSATGTTTATTAAAPAGATGAERPRPLGERRIGAPGAELRAPVFGWEALEVGTRLEGPCLVESEHTTVEVPSGWRLEISEGGWLTMRS
jgi:N-methylhydantoinase A